MKYDKEYWDYQSKIGKIGGSLNLFKFEPHISEEDTVLDFGCGGGFLLERINCEHKMGFEVNDHAIKRARSVGLNVTNDWDTIPDNSIDKIISNHSLEHVLQPVLVLKELHKKLKKDGKLVIVVPCEQLGQDEFFYKPNDQNQHVYSWCPQSLGNLIQANNFTVISCDILQHTWTPDWQTAHMDSDYHDRCRAYSQSRGVFQIHLVAVKQ